MGGAGRRLELEAMALVGAVVGVLVLVLVFVLVLVMGTSGPLVPLLPLGAESLGWTLLLVVLDGSAGLRADTDGELVDGPATPDPVPFPSSLVALGGTDAALPPSLDTASPPSCSIAFSR
jgi:hypothetical protein